MNFFIRSGNVSLGRGGGHVSRIGDFTVTKSEQYTLTGLPKFVIKDGTQFWLPTSSHYNSINEITALTEPPEGSTPRPIFVGAYKSRLNQYDLVTTGDGSLKAYWYNKVWNNKELFKGSEPVIPSNVFVDRNKGNLLNYALVERDSNSCLYDLKLNNNYSMEIPEPSSWSATEKCLLGAPNNDVTWGETGGKSFKKFIGSGYDGQRFVFTFEPQIGYSNITAEYTSSEFPYFTIDSSVLSGKNVKLKYFWTVLFTPNTLNFNESGYDSKLEWSSDISNITYDASAAINSAIHEYSINDNCFIFNYQSDNSRTWLNNSLSYKSSINGTVTSNTSLKCIKNYDNLDDWNDAETYKNFYVVEANNTANSTVEDLSKLSLITTANNGKKYLFGFGNLNQIVDSGSQTYTFDLSQGQSAMWFSGDVYVIGKSKRNIVAGGAFTGSDWDIIDSSQYQLTLSHKYDINDGDWLYNQQGWHNFSSFIPYINPTVTSNSFINKWNYPLLNDTQLSYSYLTAHKLKNTLWTAGVIKYNELSQLNDYLQMDASDGCHNYIVKDNKAWHPNRVIYFNVPDTYSVIHNNCSGYIFHRKNTDDFYSIKSNDYIPTDWYNDSNFCRLIDGNIWDEGYVEFSEYVWNTVQTITTFDEISSYNKGYFVRENNKIYSTDVNDIVGNTPMSSCWSPSSFYTIDGYGTTGWGGIYVHNNNYSYNYVGSSEFIIPASEITGSYLHIMNPMTTLLNYSAANQQLFPFITDFKFGYELCD